MGCLEGSGTPVLYIGRTVAKEIKKCCVRWISVYLYN